MALPVPPSFHTSSQSILDDTKTAIARARNCLDTIIKEAQPANATFANTLVPFIQVENELLYARRQLEFYQHVSTEEDMRKVSIEAAAMFSQYDVELYAREDFLDLIDAIQNRKETLSVESLRLIDKLTLEFRRRGLYLDQADRGQLQQINMELEELRTSYGENLKQGQRRGIWLSRSELDGISPTILDKLETGKGENDGKVFLTFSHAHSYAGLRHPKDSETRRKYYIANANKCTENLDIHKRTLAHREKRAHLLGFKNHAEYCLSEKMAKTPQVVNDFLQDLSSKLTPKRLAYHQRWRQMKSEDQKKLNRPDDGKFYDWDRFYYTRLMLDTDFVDDQKLTKHFPLNHVIQAMLNIYEQIFAMKFELVQETAWHDEVTVYAVRNQKRAGSDFLGWLYLDLYPRAGKWPGFANMAIHPGYTDANGERVHPATSLLCNMPKASDSNPTLLRHREVVILFHELGHAIHDLLSETAYARFHGTNTAKDFVEAPSQMMENWCWIPTTLKLLGQRPQSPGADNQDEGLPEELIVALVDAKKTDRALEAIAHCHLSLFDMSIHQAATDRLDTTELWNHLSHQCLGVDIHPDQEDFAQHATYGMFFNNDVNFYSYLRSQVFSCDMFHSAFKADPMNQEQGLRYRYAVLAKGGSQNELGQLKEFLGREPRPDALYKELGLI